MRWLLRTLTTTRTFAIVVFIGLFGMACRNVSDPDLWWHLKTGEYIAQHSSVPRVDPFSFTRAGQPWIAHEWLSELLLYEFDRVAGAGGLIAIFAAILCATFFLLYLRCGPHPYVAGIAVLFAAATSMPVWGVRPQVISLLLTSLWLLILERAEHNPRLLWWTLPLTLLWVNLHAGYALGLALFALFVLGEWIELRFAHSSHKLQDLRFGAFILLLDFLIVPLNPNGVHLFVYPIATLRSAAMQTYIAEWASPNFHHAEYFPFLLMVLITFGALAWSRRQIRTRDLLLLLVSFYAALGSIRLIPLFALVAIPVLSRQIASLLAGQPRNRLPSAAYPLLNALIILAMVVFACAHLSRVIREESQAEVRRFPAGAVVFLQAHPPHYLFNHYDWGGYLIWKLYPATRVFIDGRADVYGEEFLNQFADAYQLKNDWRKPLEQWNIDTVLIPPNSALASGLRSSTGWTVAYEDSQAVILKALPHSALASGNSR